MFNENVPATKKMDARPIDPETGWYLEPFITVTDSSVFLTCRDGTEQPLNYIQVLMYKAGCLNLDVLDRQYNSEPRRG